MEKSKINVFLLAGASILLFWLAWPQMYFWFLLFIAMVPILIADHQYDRRKHGGWRLFGFSYLTFLGWNLATTWWLFNVHIVGAVLANVLNPLIMTLPILLYRKTRRAAGNDLGHFSFILYWLAYEYIHLNWELSWPWLILGNGMAKYPWLVQWYEWTGHLGGSLWVLVLTVVFYRIYLSWIEKEKRISVKTILLPVLLIILPLAASLIRYYTYEFKGKEIEVVIMQPNIDPVTEKFAGSEKFIPYEEQLQRLIDLTLSKVTPETEFIVWPETAIDKVINEKYVQRNTLLQPVFNMVDSLNISLVTGVPTYVQFEEGADLPPKARYREDLGHYEVYNSALFISESAQGFYHKSKLVPGAENMPYAWLFKFLNKWMIDLGGTTGGYGSQKERTVFYNQDSIGVAPSICYESVYGDHMAEFVANGANFIFIITNDGWWGNTPGHKQHLDYARLRAIETRRSIARSANTGISAFLNQRGDVINPTLYWVQTAIRGNIQSNSEMTFYARHGDYLPRTATWLAFFVFLAAFVKNKMRKK